MPRALTPHEARIREQREASLELQRREGPSLLQELASRIGVDATTPHTQWVAAIDEGLDAARSAPDPHAIVWWVARLGHFVAATLVETHAATWRVDLDPDSQSFLRVVVAAQCASGVRHDPFRVAATVFAEGLVLADVLARIDREIESRRGEARGGRD